MAYNSLQIAASKRYSHGLMLQASYTLSRLESGAESGGPYSNYWRGYTGGLTGSDGGDRRHVLSVNHTCDIPDLSARIRFSNPVGPCGLQRVAYRPSLHVRQRRPRHSHSRRHPERPQYVERGEPGTLLLGAPDVDSRLALSGDPNALNRDFAHYFDPTRLALAGVYPNADGRGTRNFLTLPGNFANDMTLAKAFRIHESHAFELRAAFYTPGASRSSTPPNRWPPAMRTSPERRCTTNTVPASATPT